jgi:hypothetical protein
MACSPQYGLEGELPDPGPPLDLPPEGPQLQVDPATVVHEGVCDAISDVVTLRSVGTEPVTVDALEMDGDAWQVGIPPLPIVLDPGATQRLELMGVPGGGMLWVGSNDPDDPMQRVELVAAADRSPELSIVYPIAGTGLPIGPIEVAASVVDYEQDVLDVQWTSDLDGWIGTTSSVDELAVAGWDWPRSYGDHELTAMTEDDCGNIVTATIPVCQRGGWTDEDATVAGWQLGGVARWDETNEWLELTPVTGGVVGTAFDTANPVRADSVAISFDFYIGDGTGADGISLTVLDVDRVSGFVGGDGCGIGYGGGDPCTAGPALPGWSIEIDTWWNEGVDPTEADHVAFTFDGQVATPAIWKPLPEMEDNGWHHADVVVEAPRVWVLIDGAPVVDAVLDGDFDFSGFVGFTAGTGGYTNAHRIRGLAVSEGCAE